MESYLNQIDLDVFNNTFIDIENGIIFNDSNNYTNDNNLDDYLEYDNCSQNESVDDFFDNIDFNDIENINFVQNDLFKYNKEINKNDFLDDYNNQNILKKIEIKVLKKFYDEIISILIKIKKKKLNTLLDNLLKNNSITNEDLVIRFSINPFILKKKNLTKIIFVKLFAKLFIAVNFNISNEQLKNLLI